MRAAHIAGMLVGMMCVTTLGFSQAKENQDPKKKWRTKYDEFAKVCGVDVGNAATGVYARQKSKGWESFANVKAIPKDAGKEMAQYWRGEQGGLVQMAMRDGQFTRYHEYCFDGEGRLTRLTYEIRARSDGWGYATTGTVNEAGHMTPASSRFFGLRTNLTIPRPPESMDVGWLLHPKIYKRLDKLPFAKLMTTTPLESKREDAQAH